MRHRSFSIILAGENALFREGLTRILTASNFHIAASVRCVDDIDIEALALRHKSLLIAMIENDSEVPAAILRLKKLRPYLTSQRVIVLANHYRPSEVAALFQAGASACLVQTQSSDVLIKSIELVMLGETVLPFSVLSSGLGVRDENQQSPTDEIAPDHCVSNGRLNVDHDSDSRWPQLSPSEHRILGRLMAGESNKAIARAINVAEATVKAHLKSILRKIKVRNRTQAAIWAMNNLSENNGSLADGFFPPHSTTSNDDSARSVRGDRDGTLTIGPLALANSVRARSEETRARAAHLQHTTTLVAEPDGSQHSRQQRSRPPSGLSIPADLPVESRACLSRRTKRI